MSNTVTRNLRTSSPFANEERLRDFSASFDRSQSAMTMEGTVTKTGILLVLMVASAFLTYSRTIILPAPVMMAAGFSGLVAAFAMYFKPTLGHIIAPAYSVLKGLFLGAISLHFAMQFADHPDLSQGVGIVGQAILGTIGTLLGMLVLYKTGVIKVTSTFRKVVMAATLGIMFLFIAQFALSMFGIRIPGLFDNGSIGLLFSVGVVVVGALNLALDFDFFERGSNMGLPKHMEWYGAFGIMLTLVWLYTSILRLLAIIYSRD